DQIRAHPDGRTEIGQAEQTEDAVEDAEVVVYTNPQSTESAMRGTIWGRKTTVRNVSRRRARGGKTVSARLANPKTPIPPTTNSTRLFSNARRKIGSDGIFAKLSTPMNRAFVPNPDQSNRLRLKA